MSSIQLSAELRAKRAAVSKTRANRTLSQVTSEVRQERKQRERELIRDLFKGKK
jgi:hypothetical protein